MYLIINYCEDHFVDIVISPIYNQELMRLYHILTHHNPQRTMVIKGEIIKKPDMDNVVYDLKESLEVWDVHDLHIKEYEELKELIKKL